MLQRLFSSRFCCSQFWQQVVGGGRRKQWEGTMECYRPCADLQSWDPSRWTAINAPASILESETWALRLFSILLASEAQICLLWLLTPFNLPPPSSLPWMPCNSFGLFFSDCSWDRLWMPTSIWTALDSGCKREAPALTEHVQNYTGADVCSWQAGSWQDYWVEQWDQQCAGWAHTIELLVGGLSNQIELWVPFAGRVGPGVHSLGTGLQS